LKIDEQSRQNQTARGGLFRRRRHRNETGIIKRPYLSGFPAPFGVVDKAAPSVMTCLRGGGSPSLAAK
jgi:hypothetical protein